MDDESFLGRNVFLLQSSLSSPLPVLQSVDGPLVENIELIVEHKRGHILHLE